MTTDPQSRTAVRGSLVTVAGQGGRFAVQAVGLLVLARLLTPDDFGLMAMVLAVAGVASVIGDAGLSLAALASRDLSDDQRSGLFWLNAALGILTAGVLAGLAPVLANFFDRPLLEGLTYAMAPSFAILGLSVQFRAHINRELRFAALALIDVSSQALALGLAVVLAVSGAGVWSIAAQHVGAAVLTLIGSVCVARWRPRWPRTWATTWPLLRFGSNNLGAQVLNYLSINIPAIVLGRVAGPTELGFYNRAYALFALPMTQLAAPLTRVALPMLARRRDDAALPGILVRAHVLLCYTLVAGFAVLAALAEPLVLVLLGPTWDRSVPIFRVLAVAGVFQALAYVYYWAYLASGRAGWQLLAAIPGRVVMIAGSFVAASSGGVGVAALIAIGMVILWSSSSAYGMKAIGMDPRPLLAKTGSVVGVFVVCSGVTTLVDLALLAHEPPILRVGVGLALWVVCLVLLALVLPPIRRDVASVIRFFRSAV
jgi:PST family polysaccharide transporter